MVVCPGQVYYLDMANSQAWSEPGASWAGWSDPEKLYTFDPVEGWSDAQKKHLLGVQCCIWSEPMTDRGVFDRLGLSPPVGARRNRLDAAAAQIVPALRGAGGLDADPLRDLRRIGQIEGFRLRHSLAAKRSGAAQLRRRFS